MAPSSLHSMILFLLSRIYFRFTESSGATFEDSTAGNCGEITKQDFCELGLSGGADSSRKRLALQKKLNLPEHMSANALLQALNLLYTTDELSDLVKALEKDNG